MFTSIYMTFGKGCVHMKYNKVLVYVINLTCSSMYNIHCNIIYVIIPYQYFI